MTVITPCWASGGISPKTGLRTAPDPVGDIIFITGVILVSQLIPSAPASIGVFNYFVIKTIEIFYQTKVKSISNSQIEQKLVDFSSFVSLKLKSRICAIVN